MEGDRIMEIPCSGSLGSPGRGRASLSQPVLAVLPRCPHTALGSPSRLWVQIWDQEMLPCVPQTPLPQIPLSAC